MRGCNVDPKVAVPSNLAREMAVFDALPDSLRQAFREASQNYTVIPYAEALCRGAPIGQVEATFRAEDRAVYRANDRRIRMGLPPAS